MPNHYLTTYLNVLTQDLDQDRKNPNLDRFEVNAKSNVVELMKEKHSVVKSS